MECWINPKAIVWPEGLSQWKILETPCRIKPTTFQLVAHCLNQLHHYIPPGSIIMDIIAHGEVKILVKVSKYWPLKSYMYQIMYKKGHTESEHGNKKEHLGEGKLWRLSHKINPSENVRQSGLSFIYSKE